MDAKTEQKSIVAIAHALMLSLVIYLAWLTAQGIWFLVQDKEPVLMVLSDPVQSSLDDKSQTMRNIARYHLFGKEGVKVAVKSDTPQDAPKTRLHLTLKGVFTAEQASDSGAIVEERGKNADYYRVGDTLPGNAVLETVYSDRILLRRAGKLETLYFEEGKTSGASLVRHAPKNTSTQNNKVAIDSAEQFMEEATRQLSEDPDKALRSVGLTLSDQGYVYQGNNPMLSGLNLKKGDVIRSVNGHALGDLQKDKALMKTLYEQGSVDVEVVRDGASFYINYPLR